MIDYSFKPFKRKDILFPDTKIWISFSLFSIILLLSFNFLILQKTDESYTLISENRLYVKDLENDQFLIKAEMEDVEFKKNFTEKLYSHNVILRDSIKNIFDLVPEKITLTELIMRQRSLTMKGITPTKDMYKFLLEVPLKSIFDRSRVSFYLTKDNKYRFTSENMYKE
jgi:hypothetical protein